jgi:hypothetical protein
MLTPEAHHSQDLPMYKQSSSSLLRIFSFVCVLCSCIYPNSLFHLLNFESASSTIWPPPRKNPPQSRPNCHYHHHHLHLHHQVDRMLPPQPTTQTFVPSTDAIPRTLPPLKSTNTFVVLITFKSIPNGPFSSDCRAALHPK